MSISFEIIFFKVDKNNNMHLKFAVFLFQETDQEYQLAQ